MKSQAGPQLLFTSILVACLAAMFGERVTAQTLVKPPDRWLPIRGLLGKWEGDVQGEPGSGKAEREYRLALNDRFIHVANKSVYPAQEKNPKGET